MVLGQYYQIGSEKMVLISLCSLSYDFIIEDYPEVLYPMQEQMTRKWKVKPPVSLPQPLSSTSLYCGAEPWTLHVLLPCIPHYQLGFEYHLETQHIVRLYVYFILLYVILLPPSLSQNWKNNTFYINRPNM